MIIREYVTETGFNPYRKWFLKLDPLSAAKVTAGVLRLELGNLSNVKWFGGIGEYRINWGPGYRIYLAQEGKELIILFGGGTKQRQSTDIAHAKLYHQAYKQRK